MASYITKNEPTIENPRGQIYNRKPFKQLLADLKEFLDLFRCEISRSALQKLTT